MTRTALAESLRVNAAAILARARVRVVASWRETSWVVGETVFPFLTMSAFVLVYRGLHAPKVYEAFVVLGAAMTAYWNNVLWSMASQFFWEKEQGQLQLYLITPVSRMSILLGMALGGMAMTTTRAIVILLGGMLLFGIALPADRLLPAFGLFLLTLAAVYALGMILSSVFLLWGRSAWHTVTLFQEPVYLLSGFYFPVRFLGAAVGALAALLPITLGLDGIRQIFYGKAAHGFVPVVWIAPIEVALFALFLFLAHRALLLMETLGKREGRLTLRGQ
ncbi:MAG TPA: ABC transporter permease [Candidatus Eisenbacteria bacterium]|nr:ABC transporter permease [Candidatus Eisenbacteria bacterium]